MRQMRPWLASNGRGCCSPECCRPSCLIGALIYFTGWALAFSFTDIELVGKKSVDWSWIGLDNYERLFTRRGFLEALGTTVTFTFFRPSSARPSWASCSASALRTRHGMLRTVVEVSIMLGWLLPDIVGVPVVGDHHQDRTINNLVVTPFGMAPVNFLNDFALQIVIVSPMFKGTA